ncbi:MAG: Phosphatidylinositol-4-phosphate 5-kinase [Bathelium mastoideum]|nr:MAG: Phosphatidylinositol-4-phosphate 5-kinase [Bathelium mastoideum]
MAPEISTPSNDEAPGHVSHGLPSQAAQAKVAIEWDKISQHESKFVRYEKVAVLLLSWEETCNDLETREEVGQAFNMNSEPGIEDMQVDRLGTVFRELYGFEVKQEQLNDKKRAQIQMNKHLANFVDEFEDQGNSTLLIIYYAGHGWAHVPEDDKHRTELRLVGGKNEQKCQEQKWQRQKSHNSVMWNEAEKIIVGSEADVLLIFDCCYAGLIGRAHDLNRFETLAACTADSRTHIPGKSSFTAALIWALEQLYSEKQFFTSSELRARITEHQHFPKVQYPQLNQRVPSHSFIVIAPFSSPAAKLPVTPPQEQAAPQDAQASYIDIRIHFNNDDGNHEKTFRIARLLRGLRQENQLPSHRIDFLGKNTVWSSNQWRAAATLGTHWREYARRQKRRKLSHQNVGNPQGLIPAPPVSPAISISNSEVHSDSRGAE